MEWGEVGFQWMGWDGIIIELARVKNDGMGWNRMGCDGAWMG